MDVEEFNDYIDNFNNSDPRIFMIKLDLDNPTQLKLMRAYCYLRYLGADVYTMRTNKGWHIYAIFPRPINDPMNIRMMLGDDEGRIEFDEIREKMNLEEWKDTLFVVKYIITPKGIRKVHEETYMDPFYEPFFMLKEKPRTKRTGKRLKRKLYIR